MTLPAYAPDLVEAAVLAAEQSAQGSGFRAFRRERDRAYETADVEAREAGFRRLHLAWFGRLELDRVVAQVIEEYPGVSSAVVACRVVRALAQREEGADLVDRVGAGTDRGRPMLVLRLLPSTLGRPDALRALLRHELMHVADMMDPTFGYQRELPPSETGPSAEAILRDRYRVLWDTTIDGRLLRSGRADASVRHSRRREFAATFTMLGEAGSTAFERWFAESHPSHASFVDFAAAPLGSEAMDGSRCPLCRFPVKALDGRLAGAPASFVAALRAEHPSWRQDHGICPQCFDLYEARYGHQSHDHDCHP